MVTSVCSGGGGGDESLKWVGWCPSHHNKHGLWPLATATNNGKTHSGESGQNWSVKTSTSLGDTCKTILCSNDDPVQVPAPTQAVFQVTAPALVIIQQILIPQNMAIPDQNIGPDHIIPPNPFPTDTQDNKDSNPASLLPSLPKDSKFDFHSVEGSADNFSNPDQSERLLDSSVSQDLL